MWVTVVLVVTAVVTAVWAYSRKHLNFWASRGVPTAPGYLPLLGHAHKLFTTKHYRWLYIDEIYRHHGGSKICGMYEKLSPTLLIGDPELIKAVLIKDFDHFVDRRSFKMKSERDQIFSEMLTSTTGSHWKGIRSVLSPTFTSGKMKGMFHLVEHKADALVSYIHREMKNKASLTLRKTFGLYTLEIISSCAFGMETNTLTDGDSVFAQKAQKFFETSKLRMIKLIFIIMFPQLCMALKMNISIPETEFFNEAVKETIKRREEGEKRGDFLDLMMEAREDQKDPTSKTPKYPLKDATVVANSILFILAGYDTTANTLSFVAFQLARHPEEQQRVRQELLDIIKEHGELTYQALMEAKLLDAFISETLRFYPPAHFIERQCTKAYKIPGTDVIIPEKTVISIPVWSLHRDPKYWSDPEVFRPDRFLPENKDSINSGTYLPFGLGPRNCIGMRFALMETKLALAKVVLKFELSCVPGREEVELSKQMGIMRPVDDMSLVFSPLN